MRTLVSWSRRCAATTDGCSVPGKAADAHLLAYAEDHAALLEALLTLVEVDDVAWLAEASATAAALVELFADEERGGFFTTGHDAEPLIVRPKDFEDNATPSENSLAADALLRLAALTGDEGARSVAARWIAMIAPVLGEHPTAFAYLLRAVERLTHPSVEIAIVGDPDDPARRALVDVVRARLLPSAVRVIAAPGIGADLTPLLAGRTLSDGRAAVFVCEHFACRLPVNDPDRLAAELEALETR